MRQRRRVLPRRETYYRVVPVVIALRITYRTRYDSILLSFTHPKFRCKVVLLAKRIYPAGHPCIFSSKERKYHYTYARRSTGTLLQVTKLVMPRRVCANALNMNFHRSLETEDTV